MNNDPNKALVKLFGPEAPRIEAELLTINKPLQIDIKVQNQEFDEQYLPLAIGRYAVLIRRIKSLVEVRRLYRNVHSALTEVTAEQFLHLAYQAQHEDIEEQYCLSGDNQRLKQSLMVAYEGSLMTIDSLHQLGSIYATSRDELAHFVLVRYLDVLEEENDHSKLARLYSSASNCLRPYILQQYEYCVRQWLKGDNVDEASVARHLDSCPPELRHVALHFYPAS